MRRFGSVSLIFLLVLGHPAVQADTKTVLVLGDSLSAAFQMSEQDGWVHLAQEQLIEGFDFINASVSGETTAGARANLPALLEQHRPSIVILEIGANDGFRGHPPLAIRSNLMAMATLALQSGAKVIMFEMDIPANYGPAYRMAFRENYATVANASGATLIPSLFEEIFANPEWLQADGIHPNEKAQPLIRDRVVSAIQSTLRAD